MIPEIFCELIWIDVGSTEPTSCKTNVSSESKHEFTLFKLPLGLPLLSLVYPEVGGIMDFPMSKHTLIKVVCLLVYTGLIMLVPDMPNIYTFIINCLGFTVTMSASVLLFRYLNSRPPAQKNILNRILALLILLLAALTIRSLLMSFVACFWSIHLSEIVKRYPILTTAVLSYRLYVLAITVTVSTLSCGRLLLVTNPVLFHNIRHSSYGAIVAGALVFIVSVLDITYMSLVCNENTNTRPLFNFKIEMGIMTQDDFKTTIPVTDNPNEQKPWTWDFICYETVNVNNNSEYTGDLARWTIPTTGQNIIQNHITGTYEKNSSHQPLLSKCYE